MKLRPRLSLRRELPQMFGKEKKKQALLNDLPGVFRAVCKSKGLPPGDFPDITKVSARGAIARASPRRRARALALGDEAQAPSSPSSATSRASSTLPSSPR